MIEKTSPRLKRLKADLILAIPCAPEEARLKEELESKPLDYVIMHYLNWVDRWIATRKRAVLFAEDFWKTPMSDEILSGVSLLYRQVTDGEDLSLHLSHFTRTHGYTGESQTKRRGPIWADGGRGDRDFAVHVYETHHLHFTPMSENFKRKGQSDALLFVNVRRNTMRFLMVGNHKSFDSEQLKQAVVKARRADCLTIKGISLPDEDKPNPPSLYRSGFNVIERLDGESVFMGLLNSTGSSIQYLQHADRIMIFLEEWDEKLNTVDGRKEFSNQRLIPARYFEDFGWSFWHGDFCLVNGDGEAVSLINWIR